VVPGHPDYPALRQYVQDLRRRVAAGETVTITSAA